MSTTTQAPQTMDDLTSHSTPRTGATRDSTLFYIGISFALHLALLLGTSYHFIYDTYIDPNGARERAALKAAADAAAATQQAANETGPVAPSAKAPGTKTPGKTDGKPDGKTDTTKPPKPGDNSPLEGSKTPADNTPMGKALNEATPAKDIPKSTDGLGLDLNDTNPKK